MSTAKEFLDKLNAPGTPALTLQDHILVCENPLSYGEHRSLTAASQLRLKVGGTHHHLLGTVVFPPPSSRGRAPKWCGETPSMKNTIDVDSDGKINGARWLKAPALVSAQSVLSRAGREDLADHPNWAIIAKSGKRQYNAATELIGEILGELEHKSNEVDTLRDEISTNRGMFADLNARMQVLEAERLLAPPRRGSNAGGHSREAA